MQIVRWCAVTGVLLAAAPLITEAVAPSAADAVGVVGMALGALLVVGALVYSLSRPRPLPPTHVVFAAGILLLLLGFPVLRLSPPDSISAYVGLAVNAIGYGVIAVWVLILGRIHRGRSDLDSWVDGLVLFVAVSLATTWVVGHSAWWSGPDASVGVLSKVVFVFGDLILTVLQLRLIALVGRRNGAVDFLTIAVVVMGLGDQLSTAFGSSAGQDPPFVVTIRLLAWTAAVVAVSHPGWDELPLRLPDDTTSSLTRTRTALMWCGAMVPPILVVVTVWRREPPSSLLGVAIAMTVIAVLVNWRLVRAVTRVQRDTERLAVLAERDELTRLPNRRGAARAFHDAATAPDRRHAPAVAILDIDHFKAFNDTWGHLHGDRLLREAAARWSAVLPSRTMLSRFGGEEFVIVAPEADVDELATQVARLREHTPHDQDFSAGVAQARPGEDFDLVVARADAALYEAKHGGRGRTVVDGTTLWTRRPPSRAQDRRSTDRAVRVRESYAFAAFGVLLLAVMPFVPAGARSALHVVAFLVVPAAVLRGPLVQHRGRLGSLVLPLYAIAVTWAFYLGARAFGGDVTVGGLSLVEVATLCTHVGLVPASVALGAGRTGDQTAWMDAAVVGAALMAAIVPLGRLGTLGANGAVAGTTDVFLLSLVTLSVLCVGVLTQGVLSHDSPPTALVALLAAAALQLGGDVVRLFDTDATVANPWWTWFKAASLVAAAFAAVHPSAVRLTSRATDPQQRVGARRLWVLMATSIVPPVVLLLDSRSRVLDAAAVLQLLVVGASACVIMSLVVVRLHALLAMQVRVGGQLERSARTDALTRLPNRRAAREHLSALLADGAAGSAATGVPETRAAWRAAAEATPPGDPAVEGLPVVVAMLDLDHFKRFNDTNGHPAGDSLLHAAARAWRARLGEQDRLFRYGGEEFLVVSRSDAVSLCSLVDTLRAATPMGQSYSAGVAQWDGRESIDELVGRADAALYRAKGAGRGRTLLAGATAPVVDGSAASGAAPVPGPYTLHG